MCYKAGDELKQFVLKGALLRISTRDGHSVVNFRSSGAVSPLPAAGDHLTPLPITEFNVGLSRNRTAAGD